jgi:hypothetical protein
MEKNNKFIDISKFRLRKNRCSTCSFNPKGDRHIRSMVEQRCLTEASQICHHEQILNKKATHLCRGARDFQLQFYYRIGFLSTPTDEALTRKIKELKK